MRQLQFLPIWGHYILLCLCTEIGSNPVTGPCTRLREDTLELPTLEKTSEGSSSVSRTLSCTFALSSVFTCFYPRHSSLACLGTAWTIAERLSLSPCQQLHPFFEVVSLHCGALCRVFVFSEDSSDTPACGSLLHPGGYRMASTLSSCFTLWVPFYNSFSPCSLLSAGYSGSLVRFLSTLSACALVFLVVVSKETSSCEVAARMHILPRLVGYFMFVQSSS